MSFQDKVHIISFLLKIRNVDFGNKTCLEVQKDKKGSPATLYTCHESGGNQYWEYYKGVLRRDNYYLTRELVLGRFHSIPTEKVKFPAEKIADFSSFNQLVFVFYVDFTQVSVLRSD